MKYLLLFILFLPFGLMAQRKPMLSPLGSRIYTFTDQFPIFPGGDKQLAKFIRKNLKYSPEAKEADIEGLVVVQFLVDMDGTISEPQVVKKLGYGLDEEAIRLTTLFPKFSPAIKDGNPVAFRYTLPLRFGL